MKLVQGVVVRPVARDRASPARSSGSRKGLEILLKVCDAVAYAHHRGVIHRDLKPENIMVGDFGQVYLMDWGLARLTQTQPASGASAQMDAPGPCGTPQLHGAGASARQSGRDGRALRRLRARRDPLRDRERQGAVRRAPRSATRSSSAPRAGEVIPIDEACEPASASPGASAASSSARPIANPRSATRASSSSATRCAPSSAEACTCRGRRSLPARRHHPRRRDGRRGVHDRERALPRVPHRGRRRGDARDVMEPGDVFGEMALLLYEPRAATVSAVDAGDRARARQEHHDRGARHSTAGPARSCARWRSGSATSSTWCEARGSNGAGRGERRRRTLASAALGLVDATRRRRILRELCRRTTRASDELAAAVRTHPVKPLLRALDAEGALEGADPSIG